MGFFHLLHHEHQARYDRMFPYLWVYAAVLALANFFIFFWPYISGSVRNYFKYRKVRNNFRNQMRKNNVVKGPWDDRR